ncbi:hypothetical protein AVEN_244796-1 [Araneus ventricosus]|uniref:Uncharacterized protein n=1 Tax=Araneus ventricosus TaxID=182803 RepID=A0A4Y2PXL5_ARAVE|nr:hypothetical protein AVEN_244796-1 [Araneus ventricosus]
MRVTRQQISSKRNPPWKGSKKNIQNSGASSRRNFMPSQPNSGGMNGRTVTLEGTSTSSFGRSRLPKLLGKDKKIMFATGPGPFPTYLKIFSLRTTDFCGCGELGSPLHFNSCPLTSSFNLTKPSKDLEHLLWKSVLSNPLSRIKIRKVINLSLKMKTFFSHPTN